MEVHRSMMIEKKKSLNYLKADNGKLIVDAEFNNTYKNVICVDKCLDNFTEYDEAKALELVENHLKELDEQSRQSEVNEVIEDVAGGDR